MSNDQWATPSSGVPWTNEDKAALSGIKSRMGVAEQVGLLWEWRTNQGYPFLSNPKDVPVLRALLAGERLQDQPGFEWLGPALREAEDDE